MDDPPAQQTLLTSGKLWLAVLAIYWISLFTATHVPSDFPGVPGDGWDKLMHFGAFAVLGALAAIVLRTASVSPTKKWILCAWLTIVVYAALDEWTQSFVGRDASVFDWLADAAGGTCGLAGVTWQFGRSAGCPSELTNNRGQS